MWSFYIPFINLVRPCKAMAELWRRAGEDLGQLSNAVWVGTVAELLMTVAAVLAIVLIRQIGRRQAARADWLAAMVHGRIDPARG